MSTHDEGREAATEIVETTAAEVGVGDELLACVHPLRFRTVGRIWVGEHGAWNFYTSPFEDDTDGPFAYHGGDKPVLVRRPVSSPGDEPEGRRDAVSALLAVIEEAAASPTNAAEILAVTLSLYGREVEPATPVTSPKGPEPAREAFEAGFDAALSLADVALDLGRGRPRALVNAIARQRDEMADRWEANHG